MDKKLKEDINLESLEVNVPKDLVGVIGKFLIIKDGIVFDPFKKATARNLEMAARYGVLSEVKRLILNEKVNPSPKVMWFAVFEGHYEVVNFLLSIKAPIKKTSGRSPEETVYGVELQFVPNGTVEVAAHMGYLEIIKLFVRYNIPIDKRVILTAAKKGHLDMVSFFLNKGFRMRKDELLTAAVIGKIDVVKFLLERKYELNAEIMDQAAAHGTQKMVRFLLSVNAPVDETTIETAAEWGSLETVKILLDNNIPVNHLAVDSAVKKRRLDMIKLLLERKAPVHEETLFFTFREERFEELELLLDYNVSGSDSIKLELAIRNNQVLEIKKLLNERVKIRDNALMEAVWNYDAKIIKLLLDHNAPIIHDVLHDAIVSGQLKIVKLLIDKGYPIHDDDIVLSKEHPEIENFLKSSRK
uniref:Ankyrin repeat protein n=1 Tax=Pithovirus LCDPAC01 TaxID=2506600 RepID=A0A481YQ19_9VIRU|nr:MAG: ankyrin repeat protein [Pithovirus LCDPAC01]